MLKIGLLTSNSDQQKEEGGAPDFVDLLNRITITNSIVFHFRNKGLEGSLKKRVIVGVSGASGSIYGFRLLEKLKLQQNIQIHLILTRAGEKTSYLELGKTAREWKALSDYSYSVEDIGCRLASGSFPVDAMVIAPCSIHTLSAIAAGISSNLIVRAADVCLKERRRLVLAVRESPFHLGHLRSMTAVTEMGAIVAPPIPGFYGKPQTVIDLVDHSVNRILDLIGSPDPHATRWDDIANGKEEQEKEI
jgi:flavin prenyltransferase